MSCIFLTYPDETYFLSCLFRNPIDRKVINLDVMVVNDTDVLECCGNTTCGYWCLYVHDIEQSQTEFRELNSGVDVENLHEHNNGEIFYNSFYFDSDRLGHDDCNGDVTQMYTVANDF